MIKPPVDGLSVCHSHLEMLASPILPSKNLGMSCHSSVSEILRFLSSMLSFCYRHLSTIFSHLIWNTWSTLTSRKDYYGDSEKLPSFVKCNWSWSVKLSAQVSSLSHVPCLLWITASTQSQLRRLGTENSKLVLPGAKWGHACFFLDRDFKVIASGLHIIPWIYLKSWF